MKKQKDTNIDYLLINKTSEYKFTRNKDAIIK